MADFDSDIAFDEAAGGADTNSAAAADSAAAATTAAAESNTAEANKASETNAQTSGTAAGASSSASPPSATTSASTAVIPSAPAVADLAALESEAEQLSQLEVETLLSFLADYYTIDLVRLGGKDQAAKDPAVQQQQQIVTDILRVEGCAQCLVAHTYDQDECAKAEDANKSPEAAATSRAANDAFILLGCKLLHCKHVVHVLCVLKLQAKLRAAAAAGSAVVNKMILPTLDLCHSTSFFRVIAFPIGTQGSLLPSLPSAHTSPQHPSHSYYLELASTHHMSNAQNLHLSWTHAPVHSFVDVKSGGEFIMLLANHPEANHQGYGDLVRPQDLSVSAAGAPHANNASAPDFASFFLTRGKFHFTCIQQTDKGANGGGNNGSGGVPQITNHWSHTLNYDLSTTSASTPHMKLVLVDAHTKNILTIGVQKIHTGAAAGANAPAGQPSLAIAYIKYEFAPAMQTPPLSPPLSLNTHTAPTTSVVSVLAGAMGGNGGAATFGGGNGLDAFTGSTGALANSAAFGLPGASSGVVSNALSQRGFDPTAESIVRDPRDPPTMRIGTGPLATPDPLAGIAGIDPRDPPRGNQGAQQGAQAQGGMGFNQFDRQEGRGGRDRDGGRGGRFGNQQQQNAGSGASGSDFYNATNETGEWDLAMLDAALDRQLAERRNKPDPFGERSGAGGAGAGGANWDRRRGSDDRGGSSSGGGGGVVGNDNDALFLPALPSFPTHLMNQPGMVNQPVLNLTLDQVRGNVVRLSKSHSGSRFVQSKLEARDAAFFSLFYDEMREHVPDLMIDNFGHFAIEKLIALCNDEQALTLLQRLAPNINIVACQKHGSFSVQALVDTLHTPAQIYTLVEAMKPDILRIITHASGHFVVLRMLQRFPYQSTKFIDECIWANTATIATDHHGLRVVKAVLAVRRSTELTRLFKQVARLTMKLVEHQYGNYCVQGVLDVAPPGVRTNIKVKMEGKYMRLSKQKFSSNVVERCLKQSSSHWRTIIIRELIAQPAVSELLRDRYGNYVLQTALAVANAQQVQEILRSITPYLPSLRDNVRQKWKKMLRKAGSLAAAGQAGTGFTGLGGDSPQPTSPASPSSPASRSDSPFQEPPSLQLGAQQGSGGGAGGPNGPNAQSSAQAQGQRVLASVFINPNRAHHGHHAHGQHHHAHNMHNMHPSQMAAQQQQQQQLPFHAQHQGHQQFNPQLHHAANSFSPSGGAGVGVGGAGDNYTDRSGNFNSNWGAAGGAGGSSHNFGAASGAYGGGSSAPFNPNSLGSYNSSSYAGSNPAGAGVGGLGFAGANGAGFSLGSGNLSSSLAAQLNNPYGVGVAGLNALGGGVGGGVGGANSANALAGLNYFGSGGYGVGVGVGGVNNAFGALNVGGGIGAAQTAQTPNAAGTINAGLYDPNNNNLRMF